MDRIKVTNDYLQIGQTKVQYSVRKVTEKWIFYFCMHNEGWPRFFLGSYFFGPYLYQNAH